MGFTDLIIKLSNTKFARKFQYEPYIIKSVEYINPNENDRVLVIYKDADYLKSLMVQFVKAENYTAFELNKDISSKDKFDKIVLFFSINELAKRHLDFISSHIEKNGRLYSIFYLDSGKFFEWTLRLTDKDVLQYIKKTDTIDLENFVLEDELKLPKLHIAISRYRLKESNAI